MPEAISRQVAGSHYKDLPIQPAEYVHRNRIGYMEGSAIYYLTRWRDKNGIEDLRKAIHTIQLIIEMETVPGRLHGPLVVDSVEDDLKGE